MTLNGSPSGSPIGRPYIHSSPSSHGNPLPSPQAGPPITLVGHADTLNSPMGQSGPPNMDEDVPQLTLPVVLGKLGGVMQAGGAVPCGTISSEQVILTEQGHQPEERSSHASMARASKDRGSDGRASIGRGSKEDRESSGSRPSIGRASGRLGGFFAGLSGSLQGRDTTGKPPRPVADMRVSDPQVTVPLSASSKADASQRLPAKGAVLNMQQRASASGGVTPRDALQSIAHRDSANGSGRLQQHASVSGSGNMQLCASADGCGRGGVAAPAELGDTPWPLTATYLADANANGADAGTGSNPPEDRTRPGAVAEAIESPQTVPWSAGQGLPQRTLPHVTVLVPSTSGFATEQRVDSCAHGYRAEATPQGWSPSPYSSTPQSQGQLTSRGVRIGALGRVHVPTRGRLPAGSLRWSEQVADKESASGRGTPAAATPGWGRQRSAQRGSVPKSPFGNIKKGSLVRDHSINSIATSGRKGASFGRLDSINSIGGGRTLSVSASCSWSDLCLHMQVVGIAVGCAGRATFRTVCLSLLQVRTGSQRYQIGDVSGDAGSDIQDPGTGNSDRSGRSLLLRLFGKPEDVTDNK